MMMALVRAEAAVLARQLDTVAIDMIDSADIRAKAGGDSFFGMEAVVRAG